jgi:glycolate oxidase FAD binding subunit
MSSQTLSPTAERVEHSLRNRVKAHEELVHGMGDYCAVDSFSPELVFLAHTPFEVQEALGVCDRAGAAAIPWGGGRHMALGNPPARYHLALVINGLDRILEYEPADLTVTVEAGITFGKLQAALAERGQFLPIDAPADATVGGVLAANVSGPSRHAYGLPRDWLIGTRVAHADGSVSKGGGRVVKNVAGYDMPKLYVGSLGTLGVIVEATFKVAPLPAAQETLVATFPSLDAAEAAAAATDQRALALRAIVLADTLEPGSSEALAGFWLAGPTAAVERTKRELTQGVADALHAGWMTADQHGGWWDAMDLTRDPPSERKLITHTWLTPSAAATFIRSTAKLAERVGVEKSSTLCPNIGFVQTGLFGDDFEQLAHLAEELRAAAVAAGGSLVVHAAPPEVKQRVDVWGPVDPATFELMRRLKAEFDPKGTLNPGRFVGGL